MAITTYAQLKKSVQAWLKPNTAMESAEITLMADYVAMAESHFNMALAHPRMKSTVALTFTSGVATVPSDLISVEYLGMTQTPFNEIFPGNVDPVAVSVGYNSYNTPKNYEWIGSQLIVDAPVSFTASLRYKPSLPALSDSVTSNWLLAQFPSLYLFRSVLEGDTRYMDTEQLGIVNTRYEKAMADFEDMVRLQHSGRIQISTSARGVA